ELHPIAQLVALEIQHVRGATLVPLGSIRGAQDQGSLQLLDHRLERNAATGDSPAHQVVDPLPERAFGRAARAWREPQVLRLERLAVLEQHGALEQVAQLADVAGPRIIEEQALRRRRDVAEGLLELAGEAVHEESRERDDVLLALAERRNVER